MDSIRQRPIIFDVDGTLLLSGTVVRDVFAQAFEDVCGVKPQIDGLFFAGMTDRSIFRALMRRSDVAGDFEPLFTSFAKRFAERLTSVYPDAEGPRLMPGVRELLDALFGMPGTILLLGTGNCRETARIKLERFALNRYFVDGAFGSEFERREDVIGAALERSQKRFGGDSKASDAWVIGDTRNDIEAAKRVGTRVLVVATGPTPAEDLRDAGADAWLPDLSDTKRVMDILLESSP